MPGWYVIQTRAHAEDKASVNLRRQGFIVYVPKFSKRRRHARRVELIAAPLFPGYVFVAADRSNRGCRSIASTFGVARMVCFGGVPAVIDGQVIGALKARETGDLVNLPATYSAGDRVRVKDGALSHCFGLVEGMRDSERICVLIDLLGRKVRVTLDQLSLEAA